jgi:hypothetical protein
VTRKRKGCGFNAADPSPIVLITSIESPQVYVVPSGSSRALVSREEACVAICVKIWLRLVYVGLAAEVQLLVPAGSAKNIDGLEAICCIVEHAEMGEAVSVLQLVGVGVVNVVPEL